MKLSTNEKLRKTLGLAIPYTADEVERSVSVYYDKNDDRKLTVREVSPGLYKITKSYDIGGTSSMQLPIEDLLNIASDVLNHFSNQQGDK